MYDLRKHVYVIDLGHGEIKVGTTEAPESRLKAYWRNDYVANKPFVSDKIEGFRECERRVCYLLRESLYRGREFFKCDFTHAKNVINDVIFEMDNGGLEEIAPTETENVIFRELDRGTKTIIYEAAVKRGHETSRQLFVDWVDGLKEVPK